jgi:hypothetical protein
MKRKRFQTDPATQTFDFRAEVKQFFHRGVAQARLRSCTELTQSPFIMSEQAPLTLGAIPQDGQK